MATTTGAMLMCKKEMFNNVNKMYHIHSQIPGSIRTRTASYTKNSENSDSIKVQKTFTCICSTYINTNDVHGRQRQQMTIYLECSITDI